jgi:hypothetical protein
LIPAPCIPCNLRTFCRQIYEYSRFGAQAPHSKKEKIRQQIPGLPVIPQEPLSCRGYPIMAVRSHHSPVSAIHWPPVATAGSLALIALIMLVSYLTSLSRQEAAASTEVASIPRPVVPEADRKTDPPALPAEPIMPRVEEPAEPAPPAPVVEAPREKPRAVEPKTRPPLVLNRRDLRSTDELCRLLLTVPEINLDSTPGTSGRVLVAAHASNNSEGHIMPALYGKREDLAGLPFRMGLDCQAGKESADNLQVLSRKLRAFLKESVANGNVDSRHDANYLRNRLTAVCDGVPNEWAQPEALPTLVQMLQVEEKPVRTLLVELLAQMNCRHASTVLAQRALFDLHEEVREAAVNALRDRPKEEYRAILLAGFRYPWEPIADHAAEALVALGDRDSIPRLVDLLERSNPGEPDFTGRAYKAPLVRELVRVNHLRNCLLCHAPSFNVSEPVRGRIPPPGQSLDNQESGGGYGGTIGTFVRADVTYLKADFSVMQPVANSGAWPVHQRYDYVVRTREATMFETAVLHQRPLTNPQREAAAFALRELAGEKSIAN